MTTINVNKIEWDAEHLLQEHGITSIPVDPVVLANRVNIQVHNAVFKDNQISGAISKRDGVTKIYVNTTDPPTRKRFTIAHELGHYILHFHDSDGEMIDTEAVMFRSTEVDPADEQGVQETEANRFAAALLMPAALVRQEYKSTGSIRGMARIFNVSEDAMYNRLKSLRIIR